MFDNDVAEQYRTTESAEAALLGLEKQKYLSMAFEGLRRKNLINYMIFYASCNGKVYLLKK